MQTVERLQVATLVEEITSPTTTFDIDAASELIRLVPIGGRGAFLSMETTVTSSGSKVEGIAANGGKAFVFTDEEPKHLSFGQPDSWRCGHYKLEHRPGKLVIKQMFDGTYEDETGRSCRLLYATGDGTPKRLDLLHQEAIRFGPVRLALSRFRPWKFPA
jgi:hypothetical protein